MNTIHILVALVLIISCAAFPANYPESSDYSSHLDEGQLETLEPQAPAAVDLLSLLLARDAGFSADVEDTDLSAAPESPRDSRSPHHWFKKHHSSGHHYKPQHHGYSHHYKPVHHYKPYHYKPAHHYNPHGHHY